MVDLRVPIATYRLQLNRNFQFENIRTIIPYLKQLGISDIYTSPVLKARTGSVHGYDVVDPLRINPELGTENDFEKLIDDLKARGMGMIIDIVPNHMAASTENSRWMDVLENGPASPFAEFFDIDWYRTSGTLHGKVLLPMLGSTCHEVLDTHQLELIIEDGRFFIRYYDVTLPLDIKSYSVIIFQLISLLEKELGPNNPALQRLEKILHSMELLPAQGKANRSEMKQSYRLRQRIKREFRELVVTVPEIKATVEKFLYSLNDESAGFDFPGLMEGILEQQAYQLDFWKTGIKNINYRRFFDINELIAIRVENPDVFEKTHSLLIRLAVGGKITGLRIDHIDGLKDPFKYLRRLQSRFLPEGYKGTAPAEFYVVVEKILTGDESLPDEWPVCGTTGYDFLNNVNGLFVDKKGFNIIEEYYKRSVDSHLSFEDIIYNMKKQVMAELFESEIRALSHNLTDFTKYSRLESTVSEQDLTEALIEITACLPVYRTYIRTFKISQRDKRYLKHTVNEARRRATLLNYDALEFVSSVLLLDFTANLPRSVKNEWLAFVMKWQQFTGAIMAKGLEDTALYNYNPLISLNDVGGKPVPADTPVKAFHRLNTAHLTHWPHTFNATSTHDTKRSEDVRARINVLAEMPETWKQHVTQWSRWNRSKKCKLDGSVVPDTNMELFLYQTLVGAWPFSVEDLSSFKARLKEYIVKAAREAKGYTSWLSPRPEYENALLEFIDSILHNSKQNAFLSDFMEFQKRVAYYGMLNSLSQVLLKVTSPGLPDFYQGTELWDLSLVDPDNRRPVDFELRRSLLDDIKKRETEGLPFLVRNLLSSWEDGRVKLYTTFNALNIRGKYYDLFLNGEYIPLDIHGRRQENICAFARRRAGAWALTIVPRLLTSLTPAGSLPLGSEVWGNDYVSLKEGSPVAWANIFTDEKINCKIDDGGLLLSSIFSSFPVALLIGDSS